MDAGSTSMDATGGATAPRRSQAKQARSQASDIKNNTATWIELLDQTIETEILPRMISSQRHGFGSEPDHHKVRVIEPEDVAAFVALIIADDMEQVRAYADRVIVQCGGRDALLDELLTPAARLFGEMWEQDTCDFMAVTLGVFRLDQILKETAPPCSDALPLDRFDHRILLLPMPGEQHGFGLTMVADAFREVGWCVRSGPAVTRPDLLRLVRDEWFDVIGLSASADRWLKALPPVVRAVRAASCNPRLYVMLGGRAIVHCSERTRFLGADAAPSDARAALRQAENWMHELALQGAGPARAQLQNAPSARLHSAPPARLHSAPPARGRTREGG